MGDSAPKQSPFLIKLTLAHAVAVIFTVTGGMEHAPECPPVCIGPKGGTPVGHLDGAEHGISDMFAPLDALVGVFPSDKSPEAGKTPRALNFLWKPTQFRQPVTAVEGGVFNRRREDAARRRAALSHTAGSYQPVPWRDGWL